MNIIKQIIYGALRHFLTPWILLAVMYFLNQGWISVDQQHDIMLKFDGWFDFIALTAVAALPAVVFSIWNKLKTRLKLNIALQLPINSPIQLVKNITDSASIKTIAKADANKAINNYNE